jgi:hypothetical protein
VQEREGTVRSTPLGWGSSLAFKNAAALVLALVLTAVAAKAPAQPAPPPPATAAPARQHVVIGFVDIEGDPRYEPVRAYERLILKTRDHPFPGAQSASTKPKRWCGCSTPISPWSASR